MTKAVIIVDSGLGFVSVFAFVVVVKLAVADV